MERTAGRTANEMYKSGSKKTIQTDPNKLQEVYGHGREKNVILYEGQK